MAMTNTRQSYGEAAQVGVKAGLIAAVVQSGIGFVIDKLLLPPEHDNNISPRFVNRAARALGTKTHPLVDWVLGVTFHFAYGAGWGAAFSVVRRWSHLPRAVLGAAMGGLIYLLAFSRIGVGTKIGTEQHPDQRPREKHLDLMAVAWTFAFAAAAAHRWLERREREFSDPDAVELKSRARTELSA